MDLKVKQKMVNGKIVKGVINDDLTIIVPFEYEDIEVIEYRTGLGYNYKYFVCKKEDGACSLYDSNGLERVSYKDGYKDLKLFKHSLPNRNIFIAATKDDKVGILYSGYEYDKDYKPIGTYIKIGYEFGKCDEIIETPNDTVKLIKHTKCGDRIGYFYHKNIGELVEPKYINYDYYTTRCKQGVGLYTFKDEHGDKRTDSYSVSDHIEYDKLTLNVELIGYSKLKNRRTVYGIKQKVQDTKDKGYHPSFKFEDLLLPEYSSINYDADKQLFHLEKNVGGVIKKGLAGVTFDWHFSGKGCWIWGYPNFKIVVSLPCEYDDIEIIDNEHIIVRKDNKYGLFNYEFGKSSGDWDYNNRKNDAYGKMKEVVPCIYDSISKAKGCFKGIIDGKITIITDHLEEKTDNNLIVENNYSTVKQLSKEVFLCELDNGSKEVVIIKSSRKYYWQESTGIVLKINDCIDASLIGESDYDYLIKVITSDNKTNIYTIDGDNNIKLVAEDIVDIDTENKEYYMINESSGHIRFISRRGNTIFETNNLGIIPNDLKASYLGPIDRFKVTNDNITRLYPYREKDVEKDPYKDRIFTSFDAVGTYYNTFIGYTEILESGNVTRLSRINNNNEEELLKGTFLVENIVLKGKRIIISAIDKETGKKRFGVIESEKGHTCIDFDYDDIKFNSDNNTFICTLNGEILVFDADGYISEDQSKKYVGYNEKVLKINM